MTAPATSSRVLFARDAPIAVVLRRGPRRHHHLVRWCLRNHTFERGQWLIAHDVHLHDLSPDGSLLLYEAHRYEPEAAMRARDIPLAERTVADIYQAEDDDPSLPRYQREAGGRALRWTGRWFAASRPPFFTALAIWPTQPFWTGPAAARHNRRLDLPIHQTGPWKRAVLPDDLRIAHAARPKPTAADGFGPFWLEVRRRIGNDVRWAHRRPDGGVLFERDGLIQRVASLGAARLKTQVLLDMNDWRFEAIEPSDEATTWPPHG